MSTDIVYSVSPNVATDISGVPSVTLKSGVDNVQRIIFNNNNGQDISSLNFNIIPSGGGNSILDPRIWFNMPVQFILGKATNWTGIDEAFPANRSGFAQLPIGKAMTQLSININGASMERQPNKYLHALSTYVSVDDPEFQSEFSTPDLLDQIARYGTVDLNGCPGNSVSDYPYAGKYGTRRPYSFTWYYCDANGVGSSTTTPTQYIRILMNIRMTLPLSLFTNTGDKRGISQISTMTINATLDPSLYPEMLSLHKDVPVTSITASAYGIPTCQTLWYLPQDFVLDAAKDKDGKFKKVVHPFISIPACYDSNQVELANPFSTTSASPPSIGLTRVPSKIYVFAFKDLTGLSAIQKAREGTTFGRITSLTMNYNGVNNHLANYGQYELWKMSAKNGFIHDYGTAENHTGMVVCIDLSKDVSLKKLFVAEAAANSNLQVSASIGRPLVSDAASTHNKWKLRVVPVYDQLLTFDNGMPAALTDAVSLQEADKKALEMVFTKNMQSQVVGGSLLSALWGGLKKGLAVAPHVINAVKAFQGAGGPTVIAGMPTVTAGTTVTAGGGGGRLPSGKGVKGGGIDSGNPYSRLG